MAETGGQPTKPEPFAVRIATKTPDQLKQSIRERESLLKRPTTETETITRINTELDILREHTFRQRTQAKTPEERERSIREREAVLKREGTSDTEMARIRKELEILQAESPETTQDGAEHSTPHNAETEKSKEELLMEELLQKGRSEINQEIFRDHTENIAETGKPHLPLPQIQPGFGVALSWEALDMLPPSHSDDRVGELTRRGIYETVALVPLATNITETRTRTTTRSVQVTKKPFLGIFGKEKTEWKQEPYEETYNAIVGKHPSTTTEAGGIESDENAVSFLYYASARGAANSTVKMGFRPMGDDRPGHDFTMKVVLPESVARELSSYIKDNPLFARKVVDRFIRARYDAEAIKRYEYQMVRGQKLFDAHQGKMYMLDLLDTPADQVNQHHPFDPKRVVEIPKP